MQISEVRQSDVFFFETGRKSSSIYFFISYSYWLYKSTGQTCIANSNFFIFLSSVYSKRLTSPYRYILFPFSSLKISL